MNAQDLIAEFHRFGDEPEVVQRLRKWVVALAIAGKLTSTDEKAKDVKSVSKLFESRRLALYPSGELPKRDQIAKVANDDLPRGFPESEIFVRLGSIARIEKGLTGIMKANRGPYPLVVTAEDRLTCDHFDFDGEAAIVPLVSSAGHGKASLQRLHFQEGKFALGTILAAIFPHAPDLMSARFIFEYLTTFKEELLVSKMIGTANVSLSIGKLADVPIPLVSAIVQKKVDELMGLCDRLEAARAEREATRDRLTAASLARLNTPDPVKFQDDARFALNILPALATRPDQIKQLRQTILNLAIRGELVPHDSNDEPASELLKRITEENKKLLLVKGIRWQKPSWPTKSFETETKIPANWRHAYLQDLAYQITDGTHLTPKYTEQGEPFLSAQNVKPFKFMPEKHRFVSKIDFDNYRANRRPERGDVLLTRVGAGIGEAAVLDSDFEFAFYVSLCLIKVPNKLGSKPNNFIDFLVAR